MRLRVYNTVLLLILYVSAQAQYRLSGVVASNSDSSAIRDCVVFLNEGKFTSVTDSRGRFLFSDLPNGKHTLHFTSEDFQYSKVEVTISNRDQYVNVTLAPRLQVLNEVVITDEQSDFGFTRMRAVESVGIYEGKKSEVIIPDKFIRVSPVSISMKMTVLVFNLASVAGDLIPTEPRTLMHVKTDMISALMRWVIPKATTLHLLKASGGYKS
jgi:hypothetical protein